jgi:hypothetical protein
LLIIVILALVLAFCGVILYFFNLAFARKFSVSAVDMDENLGKELSPYSEVIGKGKNLHMDAKPSKSAYSGNNGQRCVACKTDATLCCFKQTGDRKAQRLTLKKLFRNSAYTRKNGNKSTSGKH